ncbi:MAG: glutathione peroxidase [Granulosicoccus sp.]|nr:glutathione peroxidase [Granulosicoccus sp.]
MNRRDCLKCLLLPSVAGTLALSRSVLAVDRTDFTEQTLGNNACNSLLSHTIRPLMSPEARPLCESYANKVLLIVNTASKCGFTPQFEGLEILHKRYSAKGFAVLGFPSDDFRQELSSEEEVAEFCELNYGVTFPMFQKIHVTSASAHPLYQDLAAATGTYPRWNFNKYLIDRDGKVITHFGSPVQPLGTQLTSAIETLL